MKRRILSAFTALALCLALLPGAALAAGETLPYISVCGTLVTTANQDDVLNDGGSVSVRYDETTAHWVIALDNAAITATGSNPGIFCRDSNLHYEIALTGENTISSGSRPCIDVTSSDLTISGPGSLTAVSTDGSCIGVSSGSGTVDGNQVSYGGNVIIDGVPNLTLNGAYLAINSTGALEIKNSTVTASNTETSNPVIKTYRDIAISDSIVSAKGAGEGVNAICSQNEGDITITNSGVTAESTWPAIYAGGGDISIAGSNVTATSTASNGLYAEGGMEITGNSDVTSTGYYPALYTLYDSIDIADSKVSATSTADYGIYAGWNLTVRGTSEVTANGGIFAVETFSVEDGKVSAASEDGIAIMTMVGIEINGGEVYARSGADAAVAVWYEQLRTTDEAAARITLGENCAEISGGQIAFTEWEEEYLYGEEEYSSMMSWTSFVAADEENPLDYSLSNALSEITIKIKGADYSKVNEALSKIPADLSEYTDESASELNRAVSAVVYDLPYTQQDAVDGYAAAIEKALAELVKKPAPYVPPVVVPTTPGTIPGEEDGGKEDDAVCDGGVSCPGSAFADLSAAAWYHEAVDFVLESGLMGGVGGGLFAPGDTMTRAMVWTVLGRMSGEDVEGGSPWYALAQAWAVADGVSDGTRPGSSITREQLVTMLYRQAGSPAVGVSELALLGRFTDGEAVSAWAEEAMAWAVSRGILTGDGGLLKPQASATRAQVAAILARFCETNEE